MAVGRALRCDFNIHLFDPEELVGKGRTADQNFASKPHCANRPVIPELIENAQDSAQIEQRLGELTARKTIQVVDVRKLVETTVRQKLSRLTYVSLPL
jgi:hypothetical protein